MIFSFLTIRESDRALEQLWKDPNAKIKDFTNAFEQLRKDLDTGTLQHNALVVSKVSTQVGILGISTYLLRSTLSQPHR